MAEEIHFENGRISNFQGLATLTLTLDLVTRHTVVHHSSTSIYTYQISLESGKLFVDGRTDGHRDISLGPIGVDLIRRKVNGENINPHVNWRSVKMYTIMITAEDR